MSNNEYGNQGTQTPAATAGEYNALTFVIQQLIDRVRTATLVQVTAVTNEGDTSPVGFVDIKPLVTQLDGYGNAVPHGVIFNCPYMRLQGGANAIILDPQVGDIGIAVFADRDISAVSESKAEAPPGSYRKFSMADGLYLGGVLNGTPTQYVQFSSAGIKIHSPVQVKLEAPSIQLTGDVVELQATTSASITAPIVAITAPTSTTVTTAIFTVNGATALNGPLTQSAGVGGGTSTMIGPLNVTNDVTAQGKSLATHIHPQSGGGDTGPPV